MSEPMSSTKIEDVLTSIRRLVSEVADEAPAPRRAPAAARPLVLTPALRVDREPARRDPAPLPLGPADRVGEAPARPGNDLLATIAELEAAVLDQPEEWEDDGTGTDLEKTWASAGFRSDAEVEEAVEVAPDPSDWPATLAEAQRIFSRERPVQEQPVFRHRDAPESLDDDHNDELIGEDDEALDAAAEAALTFYLEGGGGVTRAQLAEIVREIVREELQGRMGERITRNVRKMVRSEIARALSSGGTGD